jgi:hypothetical protein
MGLSLGDQDQKESYSHLTKTKPSERMMQARRQRALAKHLKQESPYSICDMAMQPLAENVERFGFAAKSTRSFSNGVSVSLPDPP